MVLADVALERVEAQGLVAAGVEGPGRERFDVADMGAAGDEVLVAEVAQALGQVDVLVPEEKVFVEATDLVPDLATHHEAGARGLADRDDFAAGRHGRRAMAKPSDERAARKGPRLGQLCVVAGSRRLEDGPDHACLRFLGGDAAQLGHRAGVGGDVGVAHANERGRPGGEDSVGGGPEPGVLVAQHHLEPVIGRAAQDRAVIVLGSVVHDHRKHADADRSGVGPGGLDGGRSRVPADDRNVHGLLGRRLLHPRDDSLSHVETLKGLILSGGAGTRLRPITHTSAKQLVPVANKPVLFFGIEALVDAGVTDIGIVIAPQTGDEIRDACGDGSQFGAEITYIVQDEPAGLAHAVLTAEEFLQDGPFVMYLGDNLLRDGIRGLVNTFKETEPDALILLTPVSDPSSYGVAELDGERIVRLVEKPKDPPSNLALVGVYLFSPSIFAASRALEPSWRGELEITEAIQGLIDEGKEVRSEVVSGWWKDTGQLQDMLEANRLVLEEITTKLDGDIDEESKIEGRVVVSSGAIIRKSVVRGPAVIGADAVIEDAFIGPYTSIGDSVEIRRSEVEHSIILAGSTVEDLATRMEASLLGRNVKVTRSSGRPQTLRMMVGDSSSIELT